MVRESSREEVPVNSPLIHENDIAAVIEVLRRGWISGESPSVSEFESKFATYCSRKHGVAVANGTAAIDLVIHALDFGPGDEIIVPSFAIISCISQILRSGATPVFAEADPITWNLDPTSVESLITARTKAVLVVHTYGLPAPMDEIELISRKNNLFIIEDAAEAHGLTYFGKRCGGFGLVSTFSFYANKNLTGGEGGIVVTDDDQLAERLKYFRNLAFEAKQRFVHESIGWNLRMSSMQCALIGSQLDRIDEIVLRRRQLGARYHDAFSSLSDIQLPKQQQESGKNDYWVFGIVLRGKHAGSRKHIQSELSDLGIATRPFFWPLHKQPALKSFGLGEQKSLEHAESLGNNGFYIPNGLGISEKQVQQVIDAVCEVLR